LHQFLEHLRSVDAVPPACSEASPAEISSVSGSSRRGGGAGRCSTRSLRVPMAGGSFGP
jgi:hypothetical protein